MKKVVNILVIAILVVSSLLFSDFYSKKEVQEIIDSSSNTLNIKSNLSRKETIMMLQSVADDYKVNFIKNIYSLNDDSKTEVKQYIIIGNSELYYNQLFLNSQKIDLKNDEFIASYDSGKDNQINKLNLLGNQVEVSIHLLETSNNIELNSSYLVVGENEDDLYKVVNYLNSNGIEAEVVTTYALLTSYFSNLVIVPIALTILLIIVYVYFVYFKHKEIALYKSLGYSDRDIKKIFMVSILKVYAMYSMVLLLLTFFYSMYKYTSINWRFLLYYILLLLFIMIILVVVCFIGNLLIVFIEIPNMIKNRRPMKEIQIISYIIKIALTSVLIFSLVNMIVGINNMMKVKDNLGIWNDTTDLIYTEINNVDTSSSNTYLIGSKFQKLYEQMDKDGALLFNCNGYYAQDKEVLEQMNIENYPSYLNETAIVNNNYLKKYPIYDIDGNEVNISSENPNTNYVLVPEKYIGVKEELEQAYMDAYRELRYFDANLYLEESAKEPINEKVDVEFIYVKDNQKYFTFDAMIDTDNVEKYYILDPVVEVFTPYNQGTDQYISIYSMGSIMYRVTNVENAYNEMVPVFSEYGLADNIVATPTVYSRIDSDIYYTNQELLTYMFLVIFFMILDIIIVFFISINMIESNKNIIATKTILGYSSASIYKDYLWNIMCSVVVAGIISGFLNEKIILTIVVAVILASIEVICNLFFLKRMNRKNVITILKGE